MKIPKLTPAPRVRVAWISVRWYGRRWIARAKRSGEQASSAASARLAVERCAYAVAANRGVQICGLSQWSPTTWEATGEERAS